jgi:hypothetical protein
MLFALHVHAFAKLCWPPFMPADAHYCIIAILQS